jgi:hypothetical protein
MVVPEHAGGSNMARAAELAFLAAVIALMLYASWTIVP